jgi:Tat protein translocase TatB subunit
MGFLDIGPLELLLILAIALIVFGPGKIPEIAQKLGTMVRTLRKASYDLTSAVSKEVDIKPEKPSSQPEKMTLLKPESQPKNSKQKPRQTS